MNIISQSRKDIRYLASLVRGLVALDEELERVGDITKLADAADARLASLRSEEVDLIARRAEVKALDAEIAEKQPKLAEIKAELRRIFNQTE